MSHKNPFSHLEHVNVANGNNDENRIVKKNITIRHKNCIPNEKKDTTTDENISITNNKIVVSIEEH